MNATYIGQLVEEYSDRRIDVVMIFLLSIPEKTYHGAK